MFKRLLIIAVVFGVAAGVFGLIKHYASQPRGAASASYSAPSGNKLQQLTSSFRDWKASLDPTMRILVSIGLVFLAIMGFMLSIALIFIFVMMIMRQ